MNERSDMYDLGVVQVDNYAKIGNQSYYKDKILICTEGDTNRAARRKAARKARLDKKHQEVKDEKQQD
ncbi:MAG: hypothetical protein J6Y02_10015 [Pseudobutyrivibrio sp.]|nr:hypothetical protein [Pseudobutyrivibrio sp.]